MEGVQTKVGVIGAGRWGRNVVRTFHALGALAAVSEANTALHPAISAECPGIQLHADYHDLLATPVPAVAIATPAPSHFAIAKEALLAGKDLLVEKPLTLSAAEAEELVALAEAQGRILMVGHLLLFQPAIQWIKRYLAEGQLGQLYSLHQERLNFGTARAVENALWSLGVHDIAVLLYLMGAEPEQITATGQRILQPGIEDDVYLHLQFPGGTQGHLHTSWLWPEKRRRLLVLGSEGMLLFDELEQSVTLHQKQITPDLWHQDAGSQVLFRGGGAPLTLEAQHFLAGVSSQSRSALIDGAHGAAVVKVLEAATRALQVVEGKEAKEDGTDAGPAPGSDPAVPESGH